jgi:hypothetical protein
LKREAVYVEPGVSFTLAQNRRIELTVPISIRGRNWPAGPVMNLNFTQTF